LIRFIISWCTRPLHPKSRSQGKGISMSPTSVSSRSRMRWREKTHALSPSTSGKTHLNSCLFSFNNSMISSSQNTVTDDWCELKSIHAWNSRPWARFFSLILGVNLLSREGNSQTGHRMFQLAVWLLLGFILFFIWFHVMSY